MKNKITCHMIISSVLACRFPNMKRIIIIVYLLSLGGIIHAQDTLTALKPSWFYNYVPERPSGGFMGSRKKCDITKVLYTDQPIYIYGVAVAVRTIGGYETTWDEITDAEKEYCLNFVEDTSFAHCEEFIRAYEMNKDTITILREGVCNIGTPPSYYMEIPEEVIPHWRPKKCWLLHFYEVYFDQPLLVTDSFYVGMSKYQSQINPSTGKLLYWPLEPVYTEIPTEDQAGLNLPFNILYSPDSNCAQWYYAKELISQSPEIQQSDGIFNDYTNRCLWFFPIVDSGSWNPPHWEGIAPLPSAPSVTVGPNPTTGKLSVHSEHVISYIDIYDSHGELVDIHNTRALSCELDLSALPTGVYFLHLYTSGGTVSKRVIKIDS